MTDPDLPDRGDRTVLLTGATSGIGRDAARRLGAAGATVLVHGRDRERGRATLSEVREAGGDGLFVRADLSTVEAVRALASEVRERTDALDTLCLNAACSVPTRETAMGTERTLAVNHLAPYLLAHDLSDHLADEARVVVTASGVHRRGDLDPAGLSEPTPDADAGTGYDALDAYARSKLANVLFAVELARRLPTDQSATAYHPGFVPGTGLYRDVQGWFRVAVALARRLPTVGTSVAAGGAGLARLAASPEVAGLTGAYFAGTDLALPDRRAYDAGLRERLWTESADLVGVDPKWPA